MNVFQDQATFMAACDQAHGDRMDMDQAAMYRDLIDEEVEELNDATAISGAGSIVDIVDAGLDIMVVTIGCLLSEGVPAAALAECWQEVIRTNMAKVDPATGKVRKRDDGKVLKPEGWTPPDLKTILRRHGVKVDES